MRRAWKDPSAAGKEHFLRRSASLRAGPAGGKERVHSYAYPALSRSATRNTRGEAARAGLLYSAPSGAGLTQSSSDSSSLKAGPPLKRRLFSGVPCEDSRPSLNYLFPVQD